VLSSDVAVDARLLRNNSASGRRQARLGAISAMCARRQIHYPGLQDALGGARCAPLWPPDRGPYLVPKRRRRHRRSQPIDRFSGGGGGVRPGGGVAEGKKGERGGAGAPRRPQRARGPKQRDGARSRGFIPLGHDLPTPGSSHLRSHTYGCQAPPSLMLMYHPYCACGAAPKTPSCFVGGTGRTPGHRTMSPITDGLGADSLMRPNRALVLIGLLSIIDRRR